MTNCHLPICQASMSSWANEVVTSWKQRLAKELRPAEPKMKKFKCAPTYNDFISTRETWTPTVLNGRLTKSAIASQQSVILPTTDNLRFPHSLITYSNRWAQGAARWSNNYSNMEWNGDRRFTHNHWRHNTSNMRRTYLTCSRRRINIWAIKVISKYNPMRWRTQGFPVVGLAAKILNEWLLKYMGIKLNFK